VFRAARAGVGAAPSMLSQFALGAATAAICFLAVAVFKVQGTHEENNRAIADWQQIASSAEDSGFMQ